SIPRSTGTIESAQQFRSRVQAITERGLKVRDVGSAKRLARTTARQVLGNGARTSNWITRSWDPMFLLTDCLGPASAAGRKEGGADIVGAHLWVDYLAIGLLVVRREYPCQV